MRHYYDVYSLLQQDEVQKFNGSEAYLTHKKKRFRTGDNPDITKNEAFILSDPATLGLYEAAYAGTGAIYYKAKPAFDEILSEIRRWAARL